ncbi:MAG: ATP-binding cassette domain-containing protein, partial [bacterium]
VGEQQRVEILKALDPPPELLILDEPTAVLTPEEARGLFEILRKLAARGTGIIIVTHKLGEALTLADRVVVLRRGELVTEGIASAHDERSLATAMVGEAPKEETKPPRPSPGEVVLQADEIRLRDARGREVLGGISLGVREREIFAVAGAWGNGQEELLASFCGIPVGTLQGEVRLAGRKIDNPAAARRAGLAVIPADRRKEGLVAGLPLRENLLLSIDELEDATHLGCLRVADMDAQAQIRLREFDVRPADPNADAAALSGGNQQRLILARELARSRLVAVLAANPTRGLDIEAARQVHIRLRAVAAAGAAVLIFSTDLDEIEALGDRVAVLYEGHLHEAQSRSREEIGHLMAGLEARP